MNGEVVLRVCFFGVVLLLVGGSILAPHSQVPPRVFFGAFAFWFAAASIYGTWKETSWSLPVKLAVSVGAIVLFGGLAYLLGFKTQ
jgi:hypothetical protein